MTDPQANQTPKSTPLSGEERRRVGGIAPPGHTPTFWGELRQAIEGDDQAAHNGPKPSASKLTMVDGADRQTAYYEETEFSQTEDQKLVDRRAGAGSNVFRVAAVLALLLGASVAFFAVQGADQNVGPASAVDVNAGTTPTAKEDNTPGTVSQTSDQTQAGSSLPEPNKMPPDQRSSPPATNLPEVTPRSLNPKTMTKKADGAGEGDGWRFWSGGHIEQSVTFTGGEYRFTVTARGETKGSDLKPEMELRIDGKAVGAVPVSLGELAPYTFSVSVPSGDHVVALAFTNDSKDPRVDSDLIVSDVVIQAE